MALDIVLTTAPRTAPHAQSGRGLCHRCDWRCETHVAQPRYEDPSMWALAREWHVAADALGERAGGWHRVVRTPYGLRCDCINSGYVPPKYEGNCQHIQAVRVKLGLGAEEPTPGAVLWTARKVRETGNGLELFDNDGQEDQPQPAPKKPLKLEDLWPS